MKRLIVLSFLLIGLAVYGIHNLRLYYQYQREVEWTWNLADKTSTVAAKSQYVDQFVQKLESLNLKGSYDALLFPTQDNSFDYNLLALKTLQGRLKEIQNMPPASMEYQLAIQQITAQEHGEASQMIDTFRGCWYMEYHFLCWDWIMVLTIVIMALGVAAIVISFIDF